MYVLSRLITGLKKVIKYIITLGLIGIMKNIIKLNTTLSITSLNTRGL